VGLFLVDLLVLSSDFFSKLLSKIVLLKTTIHSIFFANDWFWSNSDTKLYKLVEKYIEILAIEIFNAAQELDFRDV